MDPRTGRFISQDPFPGYAGLPQTLNPYLYCLNDPINCTDPSGELPPWLERIWASIRGLWGRGEPTGNSRYPSVAAGTPMAPYSSTPVPDGATPVPVRVPVPPQIIGTPEVITRYGDWPGKVVWACYPPDENLWVVLLYEKPDKFYRRDEYVPVGVSKEIPFPVGDVPMVVSGGAELRQVTEYRYARWWGPNRIERRYWEIRGEGMVDPGIPKIAKAQIGLQGSSYSGVDLKAEFKVGLVSIQPDKIMLSRGVSFPTEGTGAKVATGVKTEWGDVRFILAQWEIVRAAGGYDEFGERYVGAKYQFVRVLYESHSGKYPAIAKALVGRDLYRGRGQWEPLDVVWEEKP